MIKVVSLTEAVNRALSVLENDIKKQNSIVEVEALPEIEGDFTQLMRVFQNLINNSLKYAKKDVLLKIKISHTQNDGMATVILEDNGIGFEQESAEKIFQVFTQLHGKSQYGGFGIGLATVQQIVTRHKGTIKAEGELGVGAKFTINLPVKQAYKKG